MRTRRSNFATETGIIVLALSVLAGAYFKYTDITAFLGLVLLLSLFAYFWSRISMKGVSVTLKDSELYAFPGDDFDLEINLVNGKGILLMWLDLVFPLGEARCVGQEICEHFSWIMPRQSISCHSSVRAAARGVSVINNVNLRSGDGFCLSEEEKELELPRPLKLVVYPRVEPIDPSPLLNISSEPEPAKNGLYTDRTLINNVRPYAEGDSFRDINWRMLAVNDEPMVNIHESLAMRRIGFLIDLKDFSYIVKEENSSGPVYTTMLHSDEMENAISKIASYIVALNERDIICTLVIPSTAGRGGRIIVPQSRETQIVELLSALSEIEYAGEESFFPEAEMDNYSHLLGQIYKIDYRHGLMKLKGGEYEEVQ